MYALTTREGTACAETALCDDCVQDGESRLKARANNYEAGDDARGEWTNCTGNDYLTCNECGEGA